MMLLWSIWAIDRNDPRTEELLNRLLSWRRLVNVIRKRSSRMKATPRPENIPKRDVYLDCGEYLLRTVNSDDASERWANWMSDPKNLRLVNSASKAMTPQDIVAYINQFDQRSHLLIGIFEKQGGSQIGFFRLDIHI